jgi:4,5-dihydroxyphthalate decarboxylase
MLKLSFAFSPNPRLGPLVDGSVKPQNIELQFISVPPAELFYRNLKYDEFDVFEMSISESLIVRERREASRWRWSSLPIFLSKAGLLLTLRVNAQANIRTPQALKGKRFGVPDYPMTAALWMRIIFKELYGVRPADVIWYNGRTIDLSHGGVLGFHKTPPPGISLNWLTEDQTMDVMLDHGQLDAAFGLLIVDPEVGTFRNIDRYGNTPLEENPRIQKLFPDGGRDIIGEYYKKGGFLPANHMVAVQDRILKEHPWVALELYKAFQRSKELSYERARRQQLTYLIFEGDDFKNQDALYGTDAYPLGVAKNKKMLETLFRGSFEEGLTKREVSLEDIFFHTTLQT